MTSWNTAGVGLIRCSPPTYLISSLRRFGTKTVTARRRFNARPQRDRDTLAAAEWGEEGKKTEEEKTRGRRVSVCACVVCACAWACARAVRVRVRVRVTLRNGRSWCNVAVVCREASRRGANRRVGPSLGASAACAVASKTLARTWWVKGTRGL